MVGAAIGVTNDALERVKAVYDAGVDVVVLDSAHGHSKNIINKVKEIKEAFPDLDLIAGISQQAKPQKHLLTQAQTVLRSVSDLVLSVRPVSLQVSVYRRLLLYMT